MLHAGQGIGSWSPLGVPLARRTLRWCEVQQALAAEVGEPQGIRTVVFDLVLSRTEAGWRVVRFDAEPGDAATEVARRLAAVLSPDRLGAAVKGLASDGHGGEWHPDLASFEEAALRLLSEQKA